MAKKADIKISDDIIKMTGKCKKNFSCISNESGNLCKVEMCIGDRIHFIKCADENSCDYKIPFGYSFVCTCPVRKELFNRYRV